MNPHRPYTLFIFALALIAAVTGTPRLASGAPSPRELYEYELRDVWIPMNDGVRLAATLYFPKAKQRSEKFAAVLEYLPYRKDEFKDQVPIHDYFARHGFVSARVDIRGTGRSEGHVPDREYSEQEQQDAERVIAWLARQEWSTGSVGMFGISWGGFNSVQLAMRNPPALKAIIAIDATEDLFHDDCHFIDGMMHVDEYELNVDLANAVTRSPDFPTDEKSLVERFDYPPWFILSKQHPRDGAFWDAPEHPLESIRVPVFMIGGMLDGYRDSIPRMLERIKAPTKALIGPWNHVLPHEAVPGPAIEWRDQAVEWWAHWLKGRTNGTVQGPKVAVYMNHWYPPAMRLREIPGEWRAEEGWPPKAVRQQTFFLGSNHSLATRPSEAAQHELAYRPAAIQEAGGPVFWWGDLNGDQRSVDAYSLLYDSVPLSEPFSILGRPRVCLQVSASAPTADWFARLSDIAPDGQTTLVAGAGVAGAQRESMRNPSPLTPGQEYALCFDLHLTSWVFPKDHRLRLAVSNAMWPMIWPTPYAMTTTLRVGGENGSRINLPVVPDQSSLSIPQFREPEAAPAAIGELHAPTELNLSSQIPGLSWTVTHDPVHQQSSVEWRGGVTDRFPWGVEATRELIQYRADDLHPEVSSVHGEVEMAVTLSGRDLLWRGILETRSDQQNFYLQYQRELRENGKVIRTKLWEATVPRDGQ